MRQGAAGGAILGMLLIVLLPAIAPAQAQTASTTQHANPIHRSSSDLDSHHSTSAEGANGWQVALSLAAVLGLIIGLYWVSRRVLPGGMFGNAATTRAIEVLARAPLGSKHRALIVQVGQRILVIAESPGQPLSTLCQITDPNEAASLIGQLGGDQRGAMSAFLEKATNSASPSAPAANSDLAATKQELDGLLQQVRNMSQQIGRA